MIRLNGDRHAFSASKKGECLFLLAMFFINAFAIAFAQNPLPQFEIATVKSPGPQDRIITRHNYPGNRVVISLYTFALLLHEALGVQRFQVVDSN
jgi:hypothetical protein